MPSLIAIIIAYLLGSLSSSTILSRIMKFPDPRESGSKNAGATNVLRTAGKKKAIIVLAGDAAKGFIAVLIGRMLGVEKEMLGIVALAAVFGHVFPLFFKFKGGKGVATTMGSLLALMPGVTIISTAALLAVVYITRYVSLGSLVGVSVAVLLSLVTGNAQYTFATLMMALLVAYKHKDNIERLKNKTEPKISFKQ